MNATRELTDIAHQRHRDNAEHRKADARDKETDHAEDGVGSRLKAEKRRQDEVSCSEEHGKKHSAEHKQLSTAQPR